MYIYPKKKRGSRPLRIAILFVLIGGVLALIQQNWSGAEWARPLDPTPTPTLAAVFYVNQGDVYVAEGHLQNAIDAYETALELEPDNDVPYMREAELLVFTRDTAKALLRAEQAVMLAPDKPENLARYCQALDWEGHYGLAFDACECALELEPNYAPAYAYLAEVYADQAYWVLAKQTAQKAIEANFQSPEAHHNMGYALEVQGRYAEAIEFYENAITLRPNLAPFYMSAGQSYYSLGQFEQAIDRFGKAIKLNPNDPTGYDQIGWTYYTNGEHTRAIDALEQAISIDATHARSWGRLATIYYQRQNYEQAIKNFPIAIELAEKQFLHQAREIQILTEVEGLTGLEVVPILQGRFEKNRDTAPELLTAPISPVEWAHSSFIDEDLATCGHVLARNIERQTVRVNPTQTISFTQVFSQATGLATLNLTSGELTITLNDLSRPQNLPYEVTIRYRPDTIESLGFIQPDANKQVEAQFLLTNETSASVTYYYGLGLSHAYMDPPQCSEAVPWLIKAVKKEPVYFNPAWDGFRICPSEDAPPTPLPPPTPTPEENSP